MLQDNMQNSAALKDALVRFELVELATRDSDGSKVEFVRVQGKWIPRWLAERWAGAMDATKRAVGEALPSEAARDNFGRTFQGLAAVDLALDAWLWQSAHPDHDPRSMPTMLGDFYGPLIVLGYLIGGPPTTDPDFHQKTKQSLKSKSKVTLVYCYASKELKWDHETVDFDLAKHVAYQLNGKKIKVVDPDRVYAWLDKNSDWRKTSEIGAALKADFVVHIDVKDYSLTEANVNNLYRGTADCIVNVVKMDEDKKGGTVIYTTSLKSAFPKNGPVDQSTMPYAEFKKRYLSALSYEIGNLFFPTEMEDDIPYSLQKE